MISVPTTLILGAGASSPYGFPSGAQLRQRLCDPSLFSNLKEFYTADVVAAFCAAFLRSQQSSIDAFLERRGKEKIIYKNGLESSYTYEDVGKNAIATCLISCEKQEFLFRPNEDHWYQYLWGRMACSHVNDFSKNKLSIVTFNYDRSLEFYLLSALQNSFGIGEDEAAVQLKNIPIVHVYGKLGELPQFAEMGKKGRPYDSDINDHKRLAIAANGIRVIDESRNDDVVFDDAIECLKGAERICFLGFGFDETNVRRLKLEQIREKFKVSGFHAPLLYGTSVGKLDAERIQVGTWLRPALENIDSWPEYVQNNYNKNRKKFDKDFFGHSEKKSEEYLRATGVFLGE